MFCQCIVCLKDDFAFQFCVLCFFLYDIQHELRFSMLLMMIDLTAQHYMVVKVKRPLLPCGGDHPLPHLLVRQVRHNGIKKCSCSPEVAFGSNSYNLDRGSGNNVREFHAK